MKKSKFIFIILIFSILINNLYSQLTENDKKFFEKFTKTKRNINTIKLKYLKKFFPMIGLSEQDAENIYKYRLKTPISSEDDLKNIPNITEEKISTLKNYFIFKIPEPEEGEVSIDEIIEQIAGESQSEELDELETLQKYKDSPLDLNRATMAELQEFPFLSPILALKIIKYRDEKGGFKSVSELKKVPDMTSEVYEKLKPFVTIGKEYIVVKGEKKKVPDKLSGKLTTRFLIDYPYSQKYLSDNVYKRPIHNPIGLKEKLELKYARWAEAGYVAERDVGEKDLNDMQKFYIMGKDLYYIRKIIFGNYRLYFGQGLVLYPPGGPLKGGEVYKIKQKSVGIKPDLTADENAYYFGPAIELNYKPVTVFAFYSFKKYDATVEDQGTRNVSSDYKDDTPDDPSDNIITSFDPKSDGIHRTQKDEKNRETLERKFIGGRIEINPLATLKFGTTYFHSTYSIPINPEVKNNYYYHFRGDWLDCLGFDFDFIYGAINLFGEIAFSFFPKVNDPVYYNPYDKNNPNKSDNGMGLVLGKVIDVGKFETALLYRYYSYNFYNYDNGGFQEADDENEEGLYLGTRLRIDKETKLWFYADIYRHPWRRYYEIMPSRGYELYTQIERKFMRKFVYTFRAKFENKDMIDSSKLIWKEYDWRIRNEVEWNPDKNIKYALRYEFSRTAIDEFNKLYNGYLLFLDAQYKVEKRLTFYLRDIIFNTPYDARIWEYENTIPSYMENLAFYGTGMGNRIYLMIKDDVSKNLLWALKVARTTYFKAGSIVVTEVGEEQQITETTRTETLLGSSEYDFRLEIQYKF